MDTLDFVLALVDWCVRNNCNGPGQRKSLVDLIDQWAQTREDKIKRLEGLTTIDSFEILAFKDLDGVHWKDQGGYFLGMGLTEVDMLKNGSAIYAVRINGDSFRSTRLLS